MKAALWESLTTEPALDSDTHTHSVKSFTLISSSARSSLAEMLEAKLREEVRKRHPENMTRTNLLKDPGFETEASPLFALNQL